MPRLSGLEVQIEQAEALTNEGKEVDRLADRLICWLRLHNVLLQLSVFTMKNAAQLYENANASFESRNFVLFVAFAVLSLQADLFASTVVFIEEAVGHRCDSLSREHESKKLRFQRWMMDYEIRWESVTRKGGEA